MEEQNNNVEEKPVEQPVNEVQETPTIEEQEPVVVEEKPKKQIEGKGLLVIAIIGTILIIVALIAKSVFVPEEKKEHRDKNSKEEIGYEILQEAEIMTILKNYIVDMDEGCHGELYQLFTKESQEAKDLDKTYVAETIASYLFKHENSDNMDKIIVQEGTYKAAGVRLYGTAYKDEIPDELKGEYIIKRDPSGSIEISKGYRDDLCRVYLSHFKISTNRLDNNVLTVNLKTVFSVAMDEDTVIHHRDVNTKHTIGVSVIGKTDYNTYFPRGDSYKLTFKKFDDTYIFEKVELVK